MLNYFRALTPLLTEDCMVEKRHDIRADCKEKGVLYFGDTSYLVKVNNFSLGGALVHFRSKTPALHIGDHCRIKMDGGSLHEYFCEVTRIETATIALKFADTHEYKSIVQRFATIVK